MELQQNNLPDGPEPELDPPEGCKAIVAVGVDGDYVMLKKPNVFCFEEESSPQLNGFGEDFDMPPGVYEMTFSYRETCDRESGIVDDFYFDMKEAKLLWYPN